MENDKFLNYYVENLTTAAHDLLGKNIIFQTQQRISQEEIDSLKEKVTNLSAELESYYSAQQNVDKELFELRRVADDNLRLKGKADSFDSMEAENKKLASKVEELSNENNILKSENVHIHTFRNELISVRKTLETTKAELTKLKEKYEPTKVIEPVKKEQKKITPPAAVDNKIVKQQKPDVRDGGGF